MTLRELISKLQYLASENPKRWEYEICDTNLEEHDEPENVVVDDGRKTITLQR